MNFPTFLSVERVLGKKPPRRAPERNAEKKTRVKWMNLHTLFFDDFKLVRFGNLFDFIKRLANEPFTSQTVFSGPLASKGCTANHNSSFTESFFVNSWKRKMVKSSVRGLPRERERYCSAPTWLLRIFSTSLPSLLSSTIRPKVRVLGSAEAASDLKAENLKLKFWEIKKYTKKYLRLENEENCKRQKFIENYWIWNLSPSFYSYPISELFFLLLPRISSLYILQLVSLFLWRLSFEAATVCSPTRR